MEIDLGELAKGPELAVTGIRQGTKSVFSGEPGKGCTLDRDWINALRASQKPARELLAKVCELITELQGATVTERREEPRNVGYCGAGIALRIASNGVGAMLDIDDLHGGDRALIHWFNVEHPARNFSPRFVRLIGDCAGRPHHKATSIPRDWYSLAMMLEAGLMLAARGEAFEPAKA